MQSSILDAVNFSNLNCFILRAPAVWPMLTYEVDLACALHEAGSQVSMSTCSGSPKGCGANSTFPTLLKSTVCVECKSKQNNGMQWLETQKVPINFVDFDKLNHFLIPTFSKFEDKILPIIFSNKKLDKYFLDQLGINWVVETAYSTLMSITNNSQPDVGSHVKLYLCLLFDTFRATLNSRELVRRGEFDKFFIFNGRTCSYRPLMRELQNCGRDTDLYVYEHPFRGGDNDKNRYLISQGAYHHDHKNFSKQLVRQFNKIAHDKSLWLSEGEQWFDDRINSNSHIYKASVTKNQKNGFLPKAWNKKRKNVVFFTSTESEWLGVPEITENRPFLTQLEALLWLNKTLPSNCDLYVRIHPGGSKETESIQQDISEIRSNRFHLIRFDANVDSYTLAKRADLIITFGSTISVEAAWLGAKVITLGPAAYSEFGVGHTVYKISELKKLLHEYINIKIRPFDEDRINACKYIYTIKNCEHVKDYRLGSKKLRLKYKVPENFYPNILIKIIVRIFFLPINLNKALLHARKLDFYNAPLKQKLNLIKSFFWKIVP